MPSKYRPYLKKAVTWICARQTLDGRFAEHLVSHCAAATVLCELYAMTGDSTLREPAQRAIDVLVTGALARDGWERVGCGHCFGASRCEARTQAWVALCLRSARSAGLETKGGIVALRNGLQRVLAIVAAGPSETRGGYPRWWNPMSDEVSPERDEEVAALCAAIVAGFVDADPVVVDLWKAVLADDPPPRLRFPCDAERAMLATCASCMLGGDARVDWNDTALQRLSESVADSGDLDGSWNPIGCGGWTEGAGRVAVTALLKSAVLRYTGCPSCKRGKGW
jgi:hypothetical protein